MEETFIRLHNPFINLLMRFGPERRVSAHFAIAKLKIPAFTNIEADRSVSSHNEFALAVAEGIVPGMPARTPFVFFFSE
jgi:hypothetical protein